MKRARGIGPSGPSYWQVPQPPGPSYWQAQNQGKSPDFTATCENKKFGIILVQSYWFIWLFVSFVVTYLLGYIILS